MGKGGVMEVELQSGFKVQVDTEDWDRLELGRYTWNAKRHSGKTFYAEANVWVPERKKQIGLKMHRLILNAPPGIEVDHIDENGLNNQRLNLRFATAPQNQQNTGPRGGASCFKGVSWASGKGRWRVAFRCNGKHHFVGYFADEEEAARAYDAAILPLAGEFARLNFPRL